MSKGDRAFKHEYVVQVRFYLGPRVAPSDLSDAILRGVRTKEFRIPGVCRVEKIEIVQSEVSSS